MGSQYYKWPGTPCTYSGLTGTSCLWSVMQAWHEQDALSGQVNPLCLTRGELQGRALSAVSIWGVMNEFSDVIRPRSAVLNLFDSKTPIVQLVIRRRPSLHIVWDISAVKASCYQTFLLTETGSIEYGPFMGGGMFTSWFCVFFSILVWLFWHIINHLLIKKMLLNFPISGRIWFITT